MDSTSGEERPTAETSIRTWRDRIEAALSSFQEDTRRRFEGASDRAPDDGSR
jgi:hypothetical protein